MTISRVRKPWRHLARDNRGPDRLRPGTGVLISQQRHGRQLSGTVAALAALLQNRQHVFVERDWLIVGGYREVGEDKQQENPHRTAKSRYIIDHDQLF